MPDIFVDIIMKELGDDIVRRFKISDYIDLITAYTCEKDFTLISTRKLRDALTSRPGDRPLR
jgi:hypothetical protein